MRDILRETSEYQWNTQQEHDEGFDEGFAKGREEGRHLKFAEFRQTIIAMVQARFPLLV